MGYMQVYRVGNSRGESPLGKISRLLNGEGIDCEELGERRPATGCVLVDFTAGEDLVVKARSTSPQLPQVLVASTQALGTRQLDIADDFVSPDMDNAEVIRRVQCITNAAMRLTEEVPTPAHTRVLLDGGYEEEDEPLYGLAKALTEAEVEWSPLEDENDREGTGIVYTHYRRLSYARLLQSDYPGYFHIQMAPTAELRAEALTVGDFSYTPRSNPEEIVVRHKRFLVMLDRIRNPDSHREESAESKALKVLYVGDRNLGNNLKNGMGSEVIMDTLASTAGALQAAKQRQAVLIYLGSKEDAKERFAFLQLLLKQEKPPALALLFLKPPPEQIRTFCEKNGVLIIESKSTEQVRQALLGLKI